MSKTVLIVDDDPHIREVIEFALEKAGFACIIAKDGAAAMAAFDKKQPDFIVLDVGMPELDGLEVCRQIRRSSQVPILFLSARDEEVDRIVGLEIGADDYVTKPFSPRELVARVNTILKRAGANSEDTKENAIIRFGIVNFDRDRRRVLVNDEEAVLTGTEFDILGVLLRRPGVVFTRNDILDQAWADNIYVSDRTIDSHIRNLRSKLKQVGCLDVVRTVHGVGFQLGRCAGVEDV